MIPWIVSLATICASLSIPLATHIRFWLLTELRAETEFQARQRSYEAKLRACKDIVPSITDAIKQSRLLRKSLVNVLSDEQGKFYDDLSKIMKEYRTKILAPFLAIDWMEGLLRSAWKCLAIAGLLFSVLAVFSAWYEPSFVLRNWQGEIMDVQLTLYSGLGLGAIFLFAGLNMLWTYSDRRRKFYKLYALDPEAKAHIDRVYQDMSSSKTST
jgi:hypothetical protein